MTELDRSLLLITLSEPMRHLLTLPIKIIPLVMAMYDAWARLAFLAPLTNMEAVAAKASGAPPRVALINSAFVVKRLPFFIHNQTTNRQEHTQAEHSCLKHL